MTSARPRLLLAEDDPQLGPLMVRVLDEVYDVTLVADGADALAAGLAGGFDVFVIDRRLPSLDGVTIVERLRASGVRTPALILTALCTVDDKVRGLDAGADDYLVKPFDFDELFARLRAIRRSNGSDDGSGDGDGEGPFVRIGGWEFYPESRAIYSPYEGRAILTDRENALLRLLAQHPRTTFSRAQILAAVFDPADTPGTVDTYVHYVRRKTEHDLITTVHGRGYRLGLL
ncbi:response regulator transcription factor [Microbacterium sp.]|uniref:response regulator transcription factor n=1 Tax=Microbacterium sp. TaxID=51671 RepID=UPI003A9147F5